jgi:hypothetical protein
MKPRHISFSLILFSLLLGNCAPPPTPTPQTSLPPTAEIPAATHTATPVASDTPPVAPIPTEVPETPGVPAEQGSVYAPAFANYQAPVVRLPRQPVPAYSLPIDLGSVRGLDGTDLSSAQQELLSANGFVVIPPEPGKFNEFYQFYESQRYLEQPIFITTDSVFHIYHLIFDKMLRDLEREHFITDLEQLTKAMLSTSLDQYQVLQGSSLEEPARRNLAFFAVAAQLLGLPEPVPEPVKDLVDAELSLINAHSGASISPIWDRPDLARDKKLIEDYSQYVPRGHYTRSEALQRYFRAMMWYGRLTFRLRDNFETQRALLVVQALRSAQTQDGAPAVQLWRDIYEPTVFIVGKADDLSYFEYGALSDQIFGAQAGPQAFADEAKLEQFVQAARELPPPQVNSMWVWIWEDKEEATQGFRFMGQRFTLDQYVFGQLIWRNVGTLDKPRGLPKALDFFAALGSEEALGILEEMGEDQYANYEAQMQKVRTEIAALGLDSWTQNLYWSWLYGFEPLLEPKGDPYPPFMQTQAWTRKELNTSLASWTELKHDTILYAKQVMAEMGAGLPEQPPHGYVEPNPEVYARLIALVQMTVDGLSSRHLLTDLTNENLRNLEDILTFLKQAAEKELAGEILSDEEYWRIQFFGGQLEALTIAASDCEEQDPVMCRDLTDQKAALVADVATGVEPDLMTLVVLEEGVGEPAPIFVVLPDEPYRIGVGAVFSYYEFTVGPSERMTDEQWQVQVESGDAPPLPQWTSSFIAP